MPIKQSRISFIKHLFFLVKVEGESGWPELIPEKYYFATSLLRPRVGDFIVFGNPQNPEQRLVKKVTGIKNNSFSVKGVVSWSAGSADFGDIPKNLVLGKILK